MQNLGYGNLGHKINRVTRDKQAHAKFTLKDINANRFIVQNSEDLKNIFVTDLKNILKNENVFNLIQDFFDLETDLQTATERLVIDDDIFQFEEFYKNFSPVLMRALLENTNHPENGELILKSIKESLRIALEGELYRFEDHYES
jgi:hypothetical protein